MQAFAIIMLMIVIAGIQHLLNWMWRKFSDDYAKVFIASVITLAVAVLTFVLMTICAGWIAGYLGYIKA